MMKEERPRMVKSRCCKTEVFVHCANEGTAFYVCKGCQMACDTIGHSPYGDEHHDTGSQTEVEGLVDAA